MKLFSASNLLLAAALLMVCSEVACTLPFWPVRSATYQQLPRGLGFAVEPQQIVPYRTNGNGGWWGDSSATRPPTSLQDLAPRYDTGIRNFPNYANHLNQLLWQSTRNRKLEPIEAREGAQDGDIQGGPSHMHGIFTVIKDIILRALKFLLPAGITEFLELY